MTLEAAAQLLATALLILQSVSANPTLPQSVRDESQMTAQRAITEATRAIGALGSVGMPACKIVSDKYNYTAGEVVVLNYTSVNAAKLEFVPVASQSDSFPVVEGELLGTSGQYRKSVTKTGYPFLTMKATNASGQSSRCSQMVRVY